MRLTETFNSKLRAAVEICLDRLAADSIIPRIWERDHTVWKPDPAEITDRLGWLTAAADMLPEVGDLETFAADTRDAGFQDVVLLGMGGSSLAPEALRAAFGPQEQFPTLHVLDSTAPAWVRRVAEGLDLARTLFIVSSKSGGTIETMTLYRYFWGLAQEIKGERAGENFVAVTDPGSSLQELAEEKEFRRLFLNDPHIGGRYSALSYFGMVPAALAGLNVPELLRRGDAMAQRCAPDVYLSQNPGAQLGAAMAALAEGGRDKLTLINSPSLALFGLWAEQLIAESTGKEGKGILPIAQEPFAPAKEYGEDRFFVYLRLEGDENKEADKQAAALEKAGQPVARLLLQDAYDLAAEFYRWEFATAVAGAMLQIHPFDQPNVQAAKERTNELLRQAKEEGQMPSLESTGSLESLLEQAQPGDYLAIMAYLDGRAEVDGALRALRASLLAESRLPNTMGYGPRFLHSTGQFHKGGPDNGLFLQLTAAYSDDLPVPDADYTFAGLISAQAAGDYQALLDKGRRVARVNLGEDVVTAIQKLFEESV